MEPRPGRPKYFVTVAYPYPESPFHVGHARTYTMADIRARYMRMKGRVTLFSLGFHYTGTPILAMAKRIQKGDEEAIRLYRDLFHIPEEVISRFTDPLYIANYFRQDMMLACQEMGYSMDWRRTFTTVDPCYSKFIEWQFRKLRQLGLIKQGTYPVGWCPVDRNPMGMHDTKGDVDPEIGEFTGIKFAGEGGLLFVTATLRPETIFGVTNLWINPGARYVRARVNGEAWVLAGPAAERLGHQLRIEVEGELRVQELLAMKARNPVTGKWMPILPAEFVMPDHGTGVVMSVPAHSPDDYVALTEASIIEAERGSMDLQPIPVIRLDGYGEVPARYVVERSGVRSSRDPRLRAITSELYAEEFNRGVMREGTPYGGLPVREARERIKQELRAKGNAVTIYELLNKPVYCRCGAEVVVKLLEDQWFIDYGNQAWKEAAREALRSMEVLPEGYRTYYENTIEWLKEKPCARSSGLGTPLPWDRSWIIESLSDSTIYMAYYIIAKYVNSGQLRPENLVDEFFDFVLQGRGKAEEVSRATGLEPELLLAIRQEFEYFYPVDSRHSAHELIPNHLTFFIFNHVALFERRHWPRAIITNGHVLDERGRKMSKSLGNIIPLREAVRTYGADTIRLAVTGFSDLATDAEISLEKLKEYSARLERLRQEVEALASSPLPSLDPSSLELEDRWLLSRLQERVEAATRAMDRMAVKDLVVEALFLMDQDIGWYLEFARSRGRTLEDKGVRAVLAEVYRNRVKLLAPVIPHLCEELWSRMGEKGFVSAEAWPEARPELVDEEAMEAMELIARLMQDLQNLSRRLKMKPRRLVLYTASSAKRRLYVRLLEALEGGRRPDEAIREALGTMGPSVADAETVAQKMVDEILGSRPDARRRRLRLAQADEGAWLAYASPFIASRLGLSEVIVQGEEDTGRYDPKKRASLALPYRPAVYFE